MFNIVLYEPEIPPNTGNIARLCLATGCQLILKRPLGFSITDRAVRRAGLDYWKHVNIILIDQLEELDDLLPNSRRFCLSTKATQPFWSTHFILGDTFIFGPESRGLPEHLILGNPSAITIPMVNGPVRSLNLSTSVGIVVYEALRQTGFNTHLPSAQS
jgi:tRNA (cytidine/uridine-2'-O-)-methyltransferase